MTGAIISKHSIPLYRLKSKIFSIEKKTNTYIVDHEIKKFSFIRLLEDFDIKI